jgi:methionyl-tRNA formyltransferase
VIDFNLVFMGSADFAAPALRRLSDEGYIVRGVITQPDKPVGRGRKLEPTPVGRVAMELGLRLERPVSLRDESARMLFQELAPDAIVVVAYGKIIPPWLIALPKFGVINLHGSLLPKYRGAAPVQWAVANGETETGVCAMKIDEGLDTGPVYSCEATRIGPEETAREVSDRLADIGAGLLARTIEGIRNGRLTATEQDHEHATLAPILKKADGVIDWSMPAAGIHNRIRAFNPWPGTVSRFRGAICKILKSKLSSQSGDGRPGEILECKKGLVVACGDRRALEILWIQAENRNPASGIDFSNGQRIGTGEGFALA